VAPAPQILGPVIEAIKYEPEGTPISELFAELLSRAMDSQRVNEAHPAYPLLIRQLSSDEAILLKNLFRRPAQHIYIFRSRETPSRTVEVNEVSSIEGLTFPDNREFYLEHLMGLGLVNHGEFKEAEVVSREPEWAMRMFRHYQLSDVGEKFMTACMGSGT
jgi:Abortive infection alpha